MHIPAGRLLRRVSMALMASAGFASVAPAAEFTVVNNNASGAGSFLDAVANANGNGGGDTITFDQPLAGGQTITLASPGSTLTGSTVIGGSATPVLIRMTTFGNLNNVVTMDAAAPAVFRLAEGVTLEKGHLWGSALEVAATSAQTTLIIDGTARHVGNFYSYAIRSWALDTDLIVNGTVSTSGEYAQTVGGIFRSITVNGTIENTGDADNATIYLADSARASTILVASTGVVRGTTANPYGHAMWLGRATTWSNCSRARP